MQLHPDSFALGWHGQADSSHCSHRARRVCVLSTNSIPNFRCAAVLMEDRAQLAMSASDGPSPPSGSVMERSEDSLTGNSNLPPDFLAKAEVLRARDEELGEMYSREAPRRFKLRPASTFHASLRSKRPAPLLSGRRKRTSVSEKSRAVTAPSGSRGGAKGDAPEMAAGDSSESKDSSASFSSGSRRDGRESMGTSGSFSPPVSSTPGRRSPYKNVLSPSSAAPTPPPTRSGPPAVTPESEPTQPTQGVPSVIADATPSTSRGSSATSLEAAQLSAFDSLKLAPNSSVYIASMSRDVPTVSTAVAARLARKQAVALHDCKGGWRGPCGAFTENPANGAPSSFLSRESIAVGTDEDDSSTDEAIKAALDEKTFERRRRQGKRPYVKHIPPYGCVYVGLKQKCNIKYRLMLAEREKEKKRKQKHKCRHCGLHFMRLQCVASHEQKCKDNPDNYTYIDSDSSE